MTLLRAGVNIGTTSLLTVRGRKSGQPHTVPVTLVEQDGERWLVAPYGVVQWVRNLRAAETATLTRGRRSEVIAVTELEAREAAPVLKQYLLQVRVVRPYFDVTKDAPLEAFERIANRNLTSAETWSTSRLSESSTCPPASDNHDVTSICCSCDDLAHSLLVGSCLCHRGR